MVNPGGRGKENMAAKDLAAPQGVEPQYADSESAVLPLNEGAMRERAEKSVLTEYIGSTLSGQSFRDRW